LRCCRAVQRGATIAVDPTDPRNAITADIDKAPRDGKGLVEATTDVVLLCPAAVGSVREVLQKLRG
jgi:hypothetical protein